MLSVLGLCVLLTASMDLIEDCDVDYYMVPLGECDGEGVKIECDIGWFSSTVKYQQFYNDDCTGDLDYEDTQDAYSCGEVFGWGGIDGEWICFLNDAMMTFCGDDLENGCSLNEDGYDKGCTECRCTEKCCEETGESHYLYAEWSDILARGSCSCGSENEMKSRKNVIYADMGDDVTYTLQSCGNEEDEEEEEVDEDVCSTEFDDFTACTITNWLDYTACWDPEMTAYYECYYTEVVQEMCAQDCGDEFMDLSECLFNNILDESVCDDTAFSTCCEPELPGMEDDDDDEWDMDGDDECAQAMTSYTECVVSNFDDVEACWNSDGKAYFECMWDMDMMMEECIGGDECKDLYMDMGKCMMEDPANSDECDTEGYMDCCGVEVDDYIDMSVCDSDMADFTDCIVEQSLVGNFDYMTACDSTLGPYLDCTFELYDCSEDCKDLYTDLFDCSMEGFDCDATAFEGCCDLSDDTEKCSMDIAVCCDVDDDCNDGDDDYCCDGEFYCSNDSEAYAKAMGGILCPSSDNNDGECTMATAECCDIDESCTDGDDDYCCNGKFYCSNDGEEYAKSMGGILCPTGDEAQCDVNFDIVGGGPCVDENEERPPYCNPLGDFTLCECQTLCDEYEGCQAVLHADYWGCRVYFDTWENAQAMLPLTWANDDCYDQSGEEVTQGEYECGSDGYCCYKNMDSSAPEPQSDCASMAKSACKNDAACNWDNPSQECNTLGEETTTTPAPAVGCAQYDGLKSKCKNSGCTYTNSDNTCTETLEGCDQYYGKKQKCKNNGCQYNKNTLVCSEKDPCKEMNDDSDACKAEATCKWNGSKCKSK